MLNLKFLNFFNFLKSIYFWLIFFIIFSFGIIFYKINKNNINNKNNILILTTIRPITLALNKILDNIPDIEIKEISDNYMSNHMCFHDFSLTTSQVSDIENSKAIIINNILFESFINNLIKDKKNINLFDSSKNIEFIKYNNNYSNPYIWMSFDNYIKQIKNISEFLINIFNNNNNINIINKNTEKYILELKNNLENYKNNFQKFNNKKVAVFSDEFDYMLAELELIPVHLFNNNNNNIHMHDEMISAKNISEAIEKIKKNNFDFYLVSNQNKKYLDIINNSSNIKELKLSLITDSNDIYIDKMQENMQKLYEALLNAKY